MAFNRRGGIAAIAGLQCLALGLQHLFRHMDRSSMVKFPRFKIKSFLERAAVSWPLGPARGMGRTSPIDVVHPATIHGE